MLPGIKTWIVVADEREAVIYEAYKPHDPFTVVVTLGNAGAKPDRELESDKAGTRFGANGQRHGTDGERSTHDSYRADFAKRIAGHLEHGRTTESVRRFAVVAGPKMLGLLREALSAQSRAILAAAVAKDLGHFDEQSIRTHLPPEALRPEIMR
jgi:protein required for attachment to host cells